MRSRAWGLMLLLMASCVPGPVLVPGPGAALVPGTQYAATGDLDGVHVIADSSPWRGTPSDLQSLVAPVRVTIENHSGQHLLLRYKDFALNTKTGLHAHALPPFQIQRPGVAIAQPYYPWFGFHVAPYYSPWYPWASPWPGFAWDGAYYDAYYSYWEPPVPTRYMLEHALPEGVLDENGSISGYVYFQRVKPHEGPVTMTFDVIDADNQKQAGTIAIPFETAH